LNIRSVFAGAEPATEQQYLRQHIFVFISNILRAFRDARPADCLICDLIAFALWAFKQTPASQCLMRLAAVAATPEGTISTAFQ